jgi:lipopolysaccharide transport system ATP-binding protein
LLLGLSKEDILNRFGEIEAFAEIGDAIDRPVKTYSSGMMMRLAFAVQVLCDPDILIIDEALSVGDFFFQQKCLSFIRGLCGKGVTLLFVSHDMGAVRDLCERGIFLNKGRIVFDGDKLEAIRRYLQPDSSTPEIHDGTALAVADKRTAMISSSLIPQPFWFLDGDGVNEKRDRQAYIIAIGICNEEGRPITSARMGAEATIKVHYRSLCIEPVHVHLVIKNKYDHIVTAVGSHNLKVIPPILDIGQEMVFELNIQMSLEAGAYALCLSLTRPTVDGTTGALIDETPWLGPFLLCWDYSAEVPPFFGLAGMNSKGRYLQ